MISDASLVHVVAGVLGGLLLAVWITSEQLEA